MSYADCVTICAYPFTSSTSAACSNLNALTPIIAQECIERCSREFSCMHTVHGRESQTRQKSLLAWCMIYCNLNNLNNKANTCEAGEGE